MAAPHHHDSVVIASLTSLSTTIDHSCSFLQKGDARGRLAADVRPAPTRRPAFIAFFMSSSAFSDTHRLKRAHTSEVVSNKSVLVVDDDTSIRGMVRSVLHREGFAVEEVSGGNEAIARMAARRYDAVVLDVMMRDGSGHDVLHVLASLRPAVKCVVVVSAASPAAIDALPDANVQAKLRKPFDIGELVGAVHRCVTAQPDHNTAT